MQEWKQGWWREGLDKGLEEGLQQGLRKGEAQLLLRLLRHRFGALPNWVEARLSNASAEQLEQWAERLLDIDRLDALFDKP
jgi:flagellar biosynthesis/type III secretory pathway protein FliH